MSLAVAGRLVAVCTLLGSSDSKSTGPYNTGCLKKKVGVSDSKYLENDKGV